MKITSIALTLATVGACWAQFGIQIRSAGPLPGGPFNDKVVTGKPFTADGVQETNQTLADGTHIIYKQEMTIARDSQGRTRREETIPAPSDEGQTMKTVFISDPVAQANYMLGPDNVIHKFPFLKAGPATGGASVSTSQAGPAQGTVQIRQFAGGGAGGGFAVASVKEGESSTVSLGTQTISGVQATGTRTTTTIPAGQIGNDAPIVINDERWYSQDLQTVVMTKQTDPRFGE